MKLIRSPRSMRALSTLWRSRGLRVGFVPTMGALHAGHLSLLRRALRENARVVVSIFVNPLQFGPKEDFHRYPRPFAADRRFCAAAGAHALYAPPPSAMYPEGFATRVEVRGLSEPLCGARRPGHFQGIATVVLKLLEQAAPDRLYLGEKDFQQLRVLKRMVGDLDLPVAVRGCPTVREADGLACSSRNAYLRPAERLEAPRLHAALRAGARVLGAGGSLAEVRSAMRREASRICGARIDYLKAVNAETLLDARSKREPLRLVGALWIGRTRLIDNLKP